MLLTLGCYLLYFLFCVHTMSDCFVVVDNVSEGNLSEEVEADVSQRNLSQEVVADGVGSDDEIEQNEDIWLRADATPPAVSKSSCYKWPVYVDNFNKLLRHVSVTILLNKPILLVFYILCRLGQV